MTTTSTNVRGVIRSAAIAGALCAAVMLLLTAGGIAPGLPFLEPSGVDAAAAGTPPVGPLTFAPTSGNSDQLFTFAPSPTGSTCPGDSAQGGYRVDTFMTSVSNDPATLTYNAAGPVGSGFTQPLFDRFDTPIIAKNTAPDTGRILTLGPTKFSVFGPGGIPAGRYFIGVACSRLGVTETFWASTIEVTADAAGGGTAELQIALVETTPPTTTTTTTTTTVAGSTTTTTVAGGTTTTTVAGGTTTTVAGATTTTVAGATTTTVAGGSTNAAVTPSSPTPGGAYSVAFPNCTVGETITFRQPESTPASTTGVCRAPAALASEGITGLRMPAQATVGTATGSFTAAPTAPGSYTVTMTGTSSAQRTASFVVVGATTPVSGGSTGANSGGSPTGSSTGTIPSTGSSTTSLIVWGVLLLVFGRIAILAGRKPKVLTGT